MSNEWEDVKYRDVVSIDHQCPCMMAFYQDPGYDYKLQRRKKEEPMPLLQRGDKLTGNSSVTIVTKISGDMVEGWQKSVGMTSLTYEYDAILLENIKKIEREGKVIWER